MAPTRASGSKVQIRDSLHQGTARVLYAIYTGTISSRETRNDHQVHLGALKNRDAICIRHGDGTRYALTGDTAFAFDV